MQKREIRRLSELLLFLPAVLSNDPVRASCPLCVDDGGDSL